MAHRGRAQRVEPRRQPPVRNLVDIVGNGNPVMNFEGGQPYVNVGTAREILAQEPNDQWSFEKFSRNVTDFINNLSSTTGSLRHSVEHRVRKEYLPKFLLNMKRDSLKKFSECRRILTEMSSQDKIPSIAKASLKLLKELILSDPIKNETAEKLLTHEEIFRKSLKAQTFDQQDQIEQQLRVETYAFLLSSISLHCCKGTLNPANNRFREPLTCVREALKDVGGDTHALKSAVFFALEAISRLIDSDEKKSKALSTKLSKFLTFIEGEAKKQDPLTDKLMKKVTKYVNSVSSYDEELALIYLCVLARTTPGGLICLQLLAECRIHRMETERKKLFKRSTQHEPSWSVFYRIAWYMVRLAKDVDTPRETRIQTVKAESTMCLGSFWTNPDLKKIDGYQTANSLIMAMCEDLIYSDIPEIAEAVTGPLLVRGGAINQNKLIDRVLPKHLAYYHRNEDLELFEDVLHHCDNSIIYQGVMGGKQNHVTVKVARVQNLEGFHGLHDTSTTACKRIQEEIKVLKRLKEHPNIISLLASSVQSPVHYVMGLMTHGSLLDYLRKHRSPALPPQQLFDIAIQVLRALVFLHGDKTVHRMMMAKNVLVTMEDGVLCCKLSGFCGARRAKESKPYAVQDCLTYFKGSCNEKMPLRFLAPESLVSQWFSAKSDMWSFGVFLYELFTCGAVPYQEYSCMSTEDLLFRIVRKGLRMKQPRCVPTSIFKLMKDLLKVDELARPAADKALDQIEQLQPKYSSSDDDWRPYLPPIGDVVDAYSCQEIPEALLKRLKDPAASSSDRTSMADNSLQECYHDLFHDSPDRPTATVHREETLTLEKVPKALASVETYREIVPATKECEHLTAIRRLKPARSGEEFAYLYTVRPSAGNLRDYLASKSCSSPSQLEDLCRAITLALQCLHGKNVVHRDLRLEHVFVENEDGQPKAILGRFGRTKKLLQSPYDQDVSESYFEYGRPGPVDATRWSPPEVLHFGLYSFKSDIFSLGTVFQELWQAFDAPIGARPHLTVPYQGMKADEIKDFLDKNLPLEQSPSCPDWMFKLIQKCRAYHNVDRPTLEDILRVLETREVPVEWTEDPSMYDYYALVQLFGRESLSDDSDDVDVYEEVNTNKEKEDRGATCSSPEPTYVNLPFSGQQGTTDSLDADSEEEEGAMGEEEGVLQAATIWAEQPVQMRSQSKNTRRRTRYSMYHR